MQKYVLGFCFGSDGRAALIRKNRPAWQAGLLNGIGGKMEAGESAPEAMEREFREECALQVGAAQWRLAGTMREPGIFEVYVFCARSNLDGICSATDEQVELHSAAELMESGWSGCVGNLEWLMALVSDPDAPYFEIGYRRAGLADGS